MAIASGGFQGFDDLTSHSLALRADGTVVLWGQDWGQAWDGTYHCFCVPLTAVPDGLTNVVAVAAGHLHSLALRSDGTVVAWVVPEYKNIHGDYQPAIDTVPVGLTNVVSIAAGMYHSLALRADGTVIAWGLNDQHQIDVPAGLSNVVAVAAGALHSLALRADGTVVAWGQYYPLFAPGVPVSVPDGLTNVVALAAGCYHSLALRADGTVAAWPRSALGTDAPSGLTNVVAIADAMQDTVWRSLATARRCFEHP